jgi:hypothetical protein
METLVDRRRREDEKIAEKLKQLSESVQTVNDSINGVHKNVQSHRNTMSSVSDPIEHLSGHGVITKVLRTAGYATIGDVLDIDLDEIGDGNVLRRLRRAIVGTLQTDGAFAHVRDWQPVFRRAYSTIVTLLEREPVDMEPPPCFQCIFSGRWLVDPVITPSGHSYERRAILRWIDEEHTNPMTREPLSADQLVDNRNLKEAIAKFKPVVDSFIVEYR